jgi:hypothetical protein
MLTPAEEVGLSGRSLAGRVHAALARIPEPTLAALMRRVEEEASRRHLVYLRDGVVDTVRVLPAPITVLEEQLAYVHFVSLTLLNALKRLPELYLQDFAVRDVLRISPAEEQWLWECWGPSHLESNPVFGRLDAVVDFGSPTWRDSLRFVEPNLSGIGGLHLGPTCDAIITDVVLPVLRAHDGRLLLAVGQDIRDLLMQEILDHLETIGRPGRNVCFVEPKYAESGIDEQQALVRYFHDRHGLRLMHADPAELTLEAGEVRYRGDRVDLVYRDYGVTDLLELQREGADVEPMRALLRQNRVISSIAAELDQKGCWEVLTDPQLTRRYFTAEERQVFRRHVPWTRFLADRRALLPDGRTGDLLEYARRERESLVLKPNRTYGGVGVTIGPAVTGPDWEAAIERALADEGDRWVVQQAATIPVQEVPVAGPEGAVRSEAFYTVMGFAPTRYGVATMARASQMRVVNVAQHGGMCAVLVAHPPCGTPGGRDGGRSAPAA